MLAKLDFDEQKQQLLAFYINKFNSAIEYIKNKHRFEEILVTANMPPSNMSLPRRPTLTHMAQKIIFVCQQHE